MSKPDANAAIVRIARHLWTEALSGADATVMTRRWAFGMRHVHGRVILTAKRRGPPLYDRHLAIMGAVVAACGCPDPVAHATDPEAFKRLDPKVVDSLSWGWPTVMTRKVEGVHGD